MRRLAAVPLLLALASCADPTTVQPRASDTTSPPAHSYAADGAVLTVTRVGGLLPRETISTLPLWALYGDGRVLTEGPVPAIYPGAAMPNLRVTRVDAATIDRLTARAREAGVDGQERDYGDPPVADATTTVFRLSDERGTVTLRVYALSEADGGVTAEQAAARKRLRDFLASLTDGSLGPDDEAYEPTAVAVYARPYVRDASDAQLREQVVAWKGADPALGADKPAGRCTVVTGDALATVLPDLRRANTLTRWTFEGKSWRFGLRPLLPDERDCP
ncbi:MAG TPA: hypothetical protein VGX28_12580 [Frankiaceae bacterium]|jgi:hypothetical protein|nr:hypothetical protein [Frankiaceae bacterium]